MAYFGFAANAGISTLGQKLPRSAHHVNIRRPSSKYSRKIINIIMTELKQIYKCAICGNIVEVLHAGAGTLVCCGQEMHLQKANTSDGAQEKHVPVSEKSQEGIKVKVGSVAHPMEEAHFIEWIECLDCGCRKFLQPGEKPEAQFCSCRNGVGKARAYCNLHGLWQN
mgnify:CR=1 FL=1